MPYVFEGYAEPETAEEGYKFEGYQEPSFREKHGFKGMGFKKPLSVVKAGLKGVIEGTEGINPLKPWNTLPITREKQREIANQVLPDVGGEEEKIARRAGKLAPYAFIGPEAAEAKLLQLAGGVIGGEAAEALGGGETAQGIGEAAGFTLPSVTKSGIKALQKGAPKIAEKLPSGLSKPKAMESAISKYATIGKQTRNKAIQKLNEEASSLSRKSVEKNLPWVKRVEQGFDQSKLDQGFEQLDRLAKKNRVFVDMEPVHQLMDKTISKYKGIPKPHADVGKIKTEIKAFRKKPPTTVEAGLKTFRSNNAKLKNIHETSLTTGKQREYAKFLRDQNKAITESFKEALGADNAFVKQFESLNSINSKIKTAESTIKELEPLLTGRNLTPKSLANLAYDKQAQKKLGVIMKDPKAAEEIIQIAKDLNEAREALKKIPTTKYRKEELLVALGYMIPGLREYAAIYAGQKGARHVLGYWLSKPSTRREYGEALKALKNQDMDAFKKSAIVLMNSLEGTEKED